MIILELVFLFSAVYWTIINVGRVMVKNNVPALNIVLQTLGIVGFIACRIYF